MNSSALSVIVRYRAAVVAIILVPEGHAALVESNKATVGDGNTVGVAGEVGEHCFRPGEGRPGVNDRFFRISGARWASRASRPQVLDLAKECEPARDVGVGQRRQEEPPEEAGQHPHRQEKLGLQRTHRVPSSDIPPPGTIIWTCGSSVLAEPRLRSTAVAPMRAPSAWDRQRS